MSSAPAAQFRPPSGAEAARLAELERQLAARGVVASPNGPAPARPPSRPSGPAAPSGIRQVHVSRLVPNPANIRKDTGDVTELATSVRVHGILQPLIAVPHGDGRYMLIAGHRRLAAARCAGLDMVPVDVRAGGGSGSRATVLMLVENCQREDLTAIEKAEALGQLRDEHGWTMAAVSNATGLSPSNVSRYLALLELDGESRERVKSGTVGVGQALDAVRDARAARREAPARKPSGGGQVKPRKRPELVRVEAPWLTRRHALAGAAGALCDHGTRPLEGGVACGQCWEAAIRADERAKEARTP